MRVLDLFCGAGGAGMGYHQAGFEVVGVDINPQPRYPFEFHQADAMTFPLDGFDLIHASPPCQAYSATKNMHSNIHPELVEPIRARLIASGIPYIIENVIGAPLSNPIVLCGEMFGLRVIRHRQFETSFPCLRPTHLGHQGKTLGRRHGVDCKDGYYCGVYGDGTDKGSTEQWKTAMGINWMSRKELAQAIPPAYTEYIANQFLLSWRGVA
jgi:hypothetical protein